MSNDAPAPLRAPKFAPASAFGIELQAAVSEYFRVSGLSPQANASMVIKTVIIFAWTAASLALVIAPGVPVALRVVGWFALGLGYAGIGMSIGHDAIHGAYSKNEWINRALGWSFDLIGASSYIWRYTHNIAHHTYTNIDELDPDVDFEPVIRVVSSRAPRAMQRFQWLYAFPIYAVSGIRWVLYKDYADFRRRRLGPYVSLRHPWWAWASLFGGRAVALSLAIVLPILFSGAPWWQVLLGCTLAYLVTGTTMALVFLLAHIVEGPAMMPQATGRMSDSFFEHQVRTTADFGCPKIVSWFVGGLNYQVEHHLFPHICSVHYPALRPLVREISARHGLPVYEFPTMRAALAAHVSLLKRMGRPAAETAEVAVAA